jgi:hypothetical protein
MAGLRFNAARYSCIARARQSETIVPEPDAFGRGRWTSLEHRLQPLATLDTQMA